MVPLTTTLEAYPGGEMTSPEVPRTATVPPWGPTSTVTVKMCVTRESVEGRRCGGYDRSASEKSRTPAPRTMRVSSSMVSLEGPVMTGTVFTGSAMAVAVNVWYEPKHDTTTPLHAANAMSCESTSEVV